MALVILTRKSQAILNEISLREMKSAKPMKSKLRLDEIRHGGWQATHSHLIKNSEFGCRNSELKGDTFALDCNRVDVGIDPYLERSGTSASGSPSISPKGDFISEAT